MLALPVDSVVVAVYISLGIGISMSFAFGGWERCRRMTLSRALSILGIVFGVHACNELGHYLLRATYSPWLLGVAFWFSAIDFLIELNKDNIPGVFMSVLGALERLFIILLMKAQCSMDIFATVSLFIFSIGGVIIWLSPIDIDDHCLNLAATGCLIVGVYNSGADYQKWFLIILQKHRTDIARLIDGFVGILPNHFIVAFVHRVAIFFGFGAVREAAVPFYLSIFFFMLGHVTSFISMPPFSNIGVVIIELYLAYTACEVVQVIWPVPAVGLVPGAVPVLGQDRALSLACSDNLLKAAGLAAVAGPIAPMSEDSFKRMCELIGIAALKPGDTYERLVPSKSLGLIEVRADPSCTRYTAAVSWDRAISFHLQSRVSFRITASELAEFYAHCAGIAFAPLSSVALARELRGDTTAQAVKNAVKSAGGLGVLCRNSPEWFIWKQHPTDPAQHLVVCKRWALELTWDQFNFCDCFFRATLDRIALTHNVTFQLNRDCALPVVWVGATVTEPEVCVPTFRAFKNELVALLDTISSRDLPLDVAVRRVVRQHVNDTSLRQLKQQQQIYVQTTGTGLRLVGSTLHGPAEGGGGAGGGGGADGGLGRRMNVLEERIYSVATTSTSGASSNAGFSPTRTNPRIPPSFIPATNSVNAPDENPSPHLHPVAIAVLADPVGYVQVVVEGGTGNAGARDVDVLEDVLGPSTNAVSLAGAAMPTSASTSSLGDIYFFPGERDFARLFAETVWAAPGHTLLLSRVGTKDAPTKEPWDALKLEFQDQDQDRAERVRAQALEKRFPRGPPFKVAAWLQCWTQRFPGRMSELNGIVIEGELGGICARFIVI